VPLTFSVFPWVSKMIFRESRKTMSFLGPPGLKHPVVEPAVSRTPSRWLAYRE
jgi:hypothetical protein